MRDFVSPDKYTKNNNAYYGEQGSQSSIYKSHERRMAQSSRKIREDTRYNFAGDEVVRNLQSANMERDHMKKDDHETRSQLNRYAKTLANMDQASIDELIQMKQQLNCIIDNALETKSKKNNIESFDIDERSIGMPMHS